MTKMTIATDQAGRVIGAHEGHDGAASPDGMRIGVNFAPGHKLHQVELRSGVGMSAMSDPAEFLAMLQREVARA